MGLWLEQRDENGVLIAAGRFRGGLCATLLGGNVTLEEAREMCRPSAHSPVERRPWALRIRFGEDE
ncbi:MAG TPA: hypothetical protein VFT74_18790 [Isosphaeraceae bacterium]|nr:hypothetical protein [Isosphaeraceae bacterium]